MNGKLPMPKTLEISDLKFGHYYIVEVSFNPHNPIHRAILTDFRGMGIATLFRSGYDLDDQQGPGIQIDLSSLAHFKVISEIEEMQPKYDPYTLPKHED